MNIGQNSYNPSSQGPIFNNIQAVNYTDGQGGAFSSQGSKNPHSQAPRSQKGSQ
jgi:hypothetical protein